MLYHLSQGKLLSEEISRFENRPIKEKGYICWDIEQLFQEILEAIQKAKEKTEVLSVGIDTWGVDFALIDSEGELISSPVHYRDKRTQGVLEQVAQYSSLSELYFKTGNQLMEINTLFQLLKTKEKTPDIFYKANKLLMIPDYLNYRLTGKKAIEKSIASTMQLLNPFKQTWNHEILEMFELPQALFPELVEEGHVLAELRSELNLGSIKVVNVCEHDTASAVASVPVEQKKFLFISSGTWSLIGTELAYPLVNEESLKFNFTNELGQQGTTTFLKNCTGLWIVEELRRDFEARGECYSFEQITEYMLLEKQEVAEIDTDSPEFAQAGNMIEKIKTYAERTGQVVPQCVGELFKVAYTSLAKKYQKVIAELEYLLDENFEELYLIGGGSKSSYLTQCVADYTKKKVIIGLSEASSLGNALLQFVALGVLKNVQEGRALVKRSVEEKIIYPKKEVQDDTLS